MARRKTLVTIDKEIQETQRQLIAAKARYDRLAAQLTGLNRQRKQREAEMLAEALAKSGKTLETSSRTYAADEGAAGVRVAFWRKFRYKNDDHLRSSYTRDHAAWIDQVFE